MNQKLEIFDIYHRYILTLVAKIYIGREYTCE